MRKQLISPKLYEKKEKQLIQSKDETHDDNDASPEIARQPAPDKKQILNFLIQLRVTMSEKNNKSHNRSKATR